MTFRIRFPEGEDGDKARELLPDALRKSHGPAVHGNADRGTRHADSRPDRVSLTPRSRPGCRGLPSRTAPGGQADRAATYRTRSAFTEAVHAGGLRRTAALAGGVPCEPTVSAHAPGTALSDEASPARGGSGAAACCRACRCNQFPSGGIRAWRRDRPQRTARLTRRQGPGGRVLRVSAGDGRLTAEELDERLDGHDRADLRRTGQAGRRPARGGVRGESGGGAAGQGSSTHRHPQRARQTGRAVGRPHEWR